MMLDTGLNRVGKPAQVLARADWRSVAMKQVEQAAMAVVPHDVGQITQTMLGGCVRVAKALVEDGRLRGGPGLACLEFEPLSVCTIWPPSVVEIAEEAAMFGIKRPRKRGFHDLRQVATKLAAKFVERGDG